MNEQLLEGAIAAGIGLFIGLERERNDDPSSAGGHSEDHLGVRTFAILALFGWICGTLGDVWPYVPPVGLIVASALIVAHYFRVGDKDLGLTTEVAAAATFVLGMLVRHDRDLAVAIGLAVTLLLVAKPWFRRTIPKLSQIELTATLQLAIVFAVLLPLLPDTASDPWGVLSPRKIGLAIALVAGIGYVGYFLHRMLGASRGASVAGLVGGLVSSTAFTASMAQQSRQDGSLVLPGQLATFLANAVMFLRVLVIVVLIDRDIARALVGPLGMMGAVTLGGAGWKYLELRHDGRRRERVHHPTALTNPFALVPALTWGVVLSVMLVGIAVTQAHFGVGGVYFTAAAAGLADVDAITLAMSRQSQQGVFPATVAALAITIAVITNTMVKGVLALLMGRSGFGRPIAIVSAVAILVGLTTAAALLIR